MQLRLRELGYYSGSITATENAATTLAIDAFCAQNDVPREQLSKILYSVSAVPAPSATQATAAISFGRPGITGKALSWREARAQLSSGEAYTVTACYGGLSSQMRYLGGEGHAHMTPYDDTGAETLLQIFGELRSYGKQPVIIDLNGVSVAASLQPYRHSDEAGDADTTYSLYFTDSVSDLGGLPDTDHAATIRIAAGY